MNMKSNLVKEYVAPVRIMACSENVKNAEALLVNRSQQIFLTPENCLTCEGKGYVIIDFGKELHGGVRIMTPRLQGQGPSPKIRLRFGESVGEACSNVGEKGATNDHSARDFEAVLPQLSDQEWGQTGFRFVRIDFLDETTVYQLVNVYAAYTHRDLPFKGSFECSDPLVNQIYETARYTIFVNMQTQLWEGIKRDRLVWVGDLHPEMLAITDIFGADYCVEDALSLSAARTPLPDWMGGIPAYSVWFIKIVADYYQKVKNDEFAKAQLPYIEGVLEQLSACIAEDGVIDYKKASIPQGMGAFLDWPTYDTKDAMPGNRFMFIVALRDLKRLYKDLGVAEHPLCDQMLERLQKVKETNVDAKQIVAFGYLSGQLSKEETAAKLTKGGAKGLSTFMSYFIFKALAASTDATTTLSYLKEYYGGMLSRGATSFWEDFDIEWLENSGRIDEFTPEGKLDLHGDFGKFCYTGYRHSLCHGWSCGPVQYLTENVLGVEVTEAGCKAITLKPDLGDLEWAKGTFPTPYGIVEISHEKKNGEIITTFNAPSEVKVTIQKA